MTQVFSQINYLTHLPYPRAPRRRHARLSVNNEDNGLF